MDSTPHGRQCRGTDRESCSQGAASLHKPSLRSVACVDSLEAAEEAGDHTETALLNDRWPAAPFEGKPRRAGPTSFFGISRSVSFDCVLCKATGYVDCRHEPCILCSYPMLA